MRNVTRWTGDYDGLERALKLRHAIDFHVHQIIREAPIGKPIAIEKDQLNSMDWVTLQQVFDFLKPFRDETLILESHRTQGSLYKIYPSLEALSRHISRTQQSLSLETLQIPLAAEALSLPLQLASQKLHKYYSLNELSPIICA